MAWLCEEDYEKCCKRIGYEIEIKTIPNWFKTPCVICGELAKNLIPQKVLNYIIINLKETYTLF